LKVFKYISTSIENGNFLKGKNKLLRAYSGCLGANRR
jgi:hypothetical protein